MIRGEIWWADFGLPFGSEPGFKRPIIIIQSNDFNKSKINTIVVVPLTTNLELELAPGNVFIDKSDSNLSKDSIAVVSQINAIDKMRLQSKVSKLDSVIISDIEDGIQLVLDIKKFR